MSINKILSLLPGVDCGGLGGCGKATCAECAEAMAAAGNPALCPALSQEAIDAIADILGVPAVPAEDKIAFIACSGSAAGKARFAGCKSCKEAAASGFVRENVKTDA